MLEELQKLESIVEQLKGDEHHASPGSPNIDRMRKWIEHFSLRGSSDADNSQSIIDGLRSAAIEELYFLRRAQEPGGSAVDLSGSDTNLFGLDFSSNVELFVGNFINPLAYGRLTRGFFRTRNTLGMGSRSVRPGDEIWFIYGATVPIILRPLANGNYRFMGVAYVHGVMYGEAGGEIKTHKLISIE